MLKTVITVISIATLSLNFAIGQGRSHDFENKSPEESAELMTKRLTKKLGLTDAQVTSVGEIMLESATKMNELKAQNPGLEEAKKEMQSIKKESREHIKSILTSEQLAKKKSVKKNSSGKSGGKKTHQEMESKIQSMKEELDLTDQQVDDITLVMQKAKSKTQGIKSKYPELAQVEKEMKQIKRDTNKDLKKVLSPEQFEKLHQNKKGQMHQDHPHK